jgi:acyl carrier protein
MPKRKTPKSRSKFKERIDEILIAELEIERDEELQPQALLSSFPGYDEEWTSHYITALIEKEFDLEMPKDLVWEFKTIDDVYTIAIPYIESQQ